MIRVVAGRQGKLLLPLFLVVAALLLLLPGTVQAAGCRSGRCPSGDGGDTEVKVDVTITITIDPADAGSIEVDGETLEGDSFEITQGEVVLLEAIPEPGYEFEAWSGSITSTSNPLETPFYNHKSITVHFLPEPTEEETQSDPPFTVNIPEDTKARSSDGSTVTDISVDALDPHHTPQGTVIVSGVYVLGPDGSTFDPPLPLALPYEEDNLPQGASPDNLVIAFFDEDEGQWQRLESTVDEDEQVVNTLVSHFSDFCVLAPESEEAVTSSTSGDVPGFSLSGLDVSPVEPRVGDTVTVSAIATYNGADTVTHSIITFGVNGTEVDSQEVTVPEGSSTYVEFEYTPTTDITHTVTVNGLEGGFEVVPAAPSEALSQAMTLAEDDSFELPAISSFPSLPIIGTLDGASRSAAVIAGLVALPLLLILPALRRRLVRYRYDI